MTVFIAWSQQSLAANDFRVFVDGDEVRFQEPVFLENGRVYVPLRFIAEYIGATVEWNGDQQRVNMNNQQGDRLRLTINRPQLVMNDRTYMMDVVPRIRHDRTYLPARHVSEFLHANVEWNNDNREVYIDSVPLYTVQLGDSLDSISEAFGVSKELLRERNQLSGDELFAGEQLRVVIPRLMNNHPDLELLAKLIQAEAGSESFQGQVAVANVVVNRKNSSSFPNSIAEVIMEPRQFTPVTNGSINHVVPSDQAYLAAQQALLGVNYVSNALYFFNPTRTNDTFLRSRQLVTHIGNHRFVR
ncbi:stalk domain-containing protein [Desertibacillus haloalkaliphilus]|uniref:stalk domain-containing protein n=1 Tax=Desertibacillus haloalkaliphilus TaxID=1328930 RepID=UPI001C26AA0A|nr:stalk domain-containing protein [Desertibacillus haloalkaliphilus]MBU8907406.1 cell wall hydrolase [Desertibacillus haloalkaliphilus]